MSTELAVAPLERAAELEALEDVLDGCARGQGAALAIIGEAGIGKTELLRALVGSARGRDLRVLDAAGAEGEDELALGVVLDLLGPAVSDGSEDIFRAEAAAARPLFDPDTVGSGGGAEASLRGLYCLVANLAEREPLVLTVDDAHWADPGSARFLAYLARRLPRLSCALVFCVREAEPGSPGGLLAPLFAAAKVVLRPRRLSLDACATITRGSLPDADEAVLRACHAATRGNPFLLEQLLTEIQGRGLTGADAAEIEAIGSRRVANWLHDRLAHLGDPALQLARAIAVLGRDADLGASAHIAGVELEVAESLVPALVKSAILRDDDGLKFVHPLVRSSVLAAATEAERARLHSRTARLLDRRGAPPEAVAVHLLRTEPCDDAWVVRTLRRAAGRASGGGAPDEAAAYLRRALREPPRPDDLPATLREAGAAAAQAGAEDAEELLLTAHERAETPEARAGVALDLAAVLLFRSRAPEAIDVLDAALGDLGDGSGPLAAQVESALLLNSQSTLPARARLEGPLARLWARRDDLTKDAELPLLAILATEAALTRTADDAATLAERAIAEGRLLKVFGSDAPFHQLAATALALADHFAAAEAAMSAALDEARTRGSLRAFVLVSSWRAWARLRAGRLTDAEADARSALEAGEGASSLLLVLPVTLACLMEVATERGEPASDEGKLAALVDDPDSGLFQPLTLARARRALAERDPDAALDELVACREWATRWGCDAPSYVPWRSLMAEAHLQRQDPGDALPLAMDELAAARVFGPPSAIGRAARVAGTAARSVSLLGEACEVLDGSGARLEHGRALLALGDLLRRAGERAASREVLRQALDVFVHCGATVLAERAHEELAIAGAKPRRLHLHGPAALTASEMRVARMAAAGMTNRDIARELFVGLRTVEMHLSNAYRKLQIGGRTALGTALGEHLDA